MKIIVMFRESDWPLRVDALDSLKAAADRGYLALDGIGDRITHHFECGVTAILVVTSFECTEDVEDLVVEAYSVQEDRVHRDVVFGSVQVDTYGWPDFLRLSAQDFIDRLAYRLTCEVVAYVY